ncbi:hypothetical protein AURDEDRAFT_167859 [Auricularia subglabra TFB-10046 SS5]|nr:hypothetical protein AURDEDRAFT_167859 [Auricularia subglabra TFB-10046 SS5]
MHHGFPYRSETETPDPRTTTTAHVPPGFNAKKYEAPSTRTTARTSSTQRTQTATKTLTQTPPSTRTTSPSSSATTTTTTPDPASDDVKPVRRSSRRHSQKRLRIHPPDGRMRAAVNYNEDLITYGEDDNDEDDEDEDEDVGPRSSKDKAASSSVRKEQEREQPRTGPRKLVASDPHRRGPARRLTDGEYAEDDDGEDEEEDEAGSDAGEPDHDEEENRAYSLRPRGNVDYHIPMPLEDLPMDPKDRLPPQHIAFLQEMMLLPLLYPELFQRFNVTPPRGVLFHDPPGTGKTLLARALSPRAAAAAAAKSWVGEAERQLRLLFEEARAARRSRPSSSSTRLMGSRPAQHRFLQQGRTDHHSRAHSFASIEPDTWVTSIHEGLR